MKPLIIITGPTAVGKTGLSIELAKSLNGEIVSADSMQVYRYMDIGSAKIMPEEMQGIPHHLIDVLDPREDFNVVTFQQMAKAALEGIYERGRIPILTGGTGFYIQALLRDIDFTETEDDPAFRKELLAIVAEQGPEALHQLLENCDPQAASEIHANNIQRTLRALEYFHLTGKRISEHNAEEKLRRSPYHYVYLVLNRERCEIYRRIDCRVDRMISMGLVEEVMRLKEMGCERGMTSMQGLGYKEILDYLDGRSESLEAAVTAIKQSTRHYAKRQLTWFKRESDTIWLSAGDADLLGQIQKILTEKEII